MPPISTIANLTIKSENISSASTISSSSTSHHHRAATKINGLEQFYTAAASPIVTETESPPSSPPSPTRSPSPVAPSGRSTSYSLPDIASGCSRTVPISWTNSGSTSTTSTSLVHVCIPVVQPTATPPPLPNHPLLTAPWLNGPCMHSLAIAM